MVPLGPPLLAYGSNCKAMLTAVDGAVELVVDRPYKAGEPIVVWYSIFLASQLVIGQKNDLHCLCFCIIIFTIKFRIGGFQVWPTA